MAENYPRFMAIMAAAFDRLRARKRTYGVFSPATDRRDLPREAEEELLDAIVYAYLAILKLELAQAGHRLEGYQLVFVPLPGDSRTMARLRRGLRKSAGSSTHRAHGRGNSELFWPLLGAKPTRTAEPAAVEPPWTVLG